MMLCVMIKKATEIPIKATSFNENFSINLIAKNNKSGNKAKDKDSPIDPLTYKSTIR